MKPFSTFGLPMSISFVLWSFIGLLRFLWENFWLRYIKPPKITATFSVPTYTPADIAAVIPAHNEELVITRCIRALRHGLPANQIHVASDGSSDRTYELAVAERVNVENIQPGKGKMKALTHLINKYNLYANYKFIFIVDADTQIDKHFVPRALKMFNQDQGLAVVFGAVRITNFPNHIIPRLRYYFIAYRERLTRMLQVFYTYGQTWKYTNVSYVVPGYATMYKSHILQHLGLETPGLLIEDFHLAFQLHKQKLGTAGYQSNIIGWDQAPDNLRDYWWQVTRWNIGYFQTVKINGFWPSFFWLTHGLFSMEIWLHTVFLLVLPVHIFFLSTKFFVSAHPLLASFAASYPAWSPFPYETLRDIFLFIFVYDYLVSCIAGILLKRPMYFFYGLFFFVLHYLTAFILISSAYFGFTSFSEGRWKPPTRQKPAEIG